MTKVAVFIKKIALFLSVNIECSCLLILNESADKFLQYFSTICVDVLLSSSLLFFFFFLVFLGKNLLKYFLIKPFHMLQIINSHEINTMFNSNRIIKRRNREREKKNNNQSRLLSSESLALLHSPAAAAHRTYWCSPTPLINLYLWWSLFLLTSGNPNSSVAPVTDNHFFGSDRIESRHPTKKTQKEKRIKWNITLLLIVRRFLIKL